MRALLVEVKRRFHALSGSLDGYQNYNVVEAVFQKTKLYEPDHAWPELFGISSVLDFGGACGHHYKMARKTCPNIRWAVVETPEMTNRAFELSTENLKFFSEISEAANWLNKIDLVYSNGALHCTSEPKEHLRKLCSLRASSMWWDRTDLSTEEEKRVTNYSLLGEHGPGTNRRFKGLAVKTQKILISESAFLNAHQGYDLLARGKDWFRFTASDKL